MRVNTLAFYIRGKDKIIYRHAARLIDMDSIDYSTCYLHHPMDLTKLAKLIDKLGKENQKARLKLINAIKYRFNQNQLDQKDKFLSIINKTNTIETEWN